MLVIGLMSGTSADGVDAALVDWPEGPEARPFRLLSHVECPFPPGLQGRIHRLAAGGLPGEAVLGELGRLDVELAERFADAARRAAHKAGVADEEVAAVASHGQTVWHAPADGATLQIGSPSRIAERCGWTVIGDFRPRDQAAGGEGAPLAPFFHWAVLSADDEDRVALNLGGIANLTWLPAGGDPDAVLAFDVGPANSLLDGAVAAWTGGAERCDLDGRRARAGRRDEALLTELLDDDFLRRPPPKSTGRERYGQAEARALVERQQRAGGTLEDLAATLTAFTAESLGRAVDAHLPSRPGTLLLGGGGARNPALREAIAGALPGVGLMDFDAAGVPTQAAEAMAFSLMGRNALLGLPNHLPACTGARRAAILGVVAPAGGGP